MRPTLTRNGPLFRAPQWSFADKKEDLQKSRIANPIALRGKKILAHQAFQAKSYVEIDEKRIAAQKKDDAKRKETLLMQKQVTQRVQIKPPTPPTAQPDTMKKATPPKELPISNEVKKRQMMMQRFLKHQTEKASLESKKKEELQQKREIRKEEKAEAKEEIIPGSVPMLLPKQPTTTGVDETTTPNATTKITFKRKREVIEPQQIQKKPEAVSQPILPPSTIEPPNKKKK